LTIWSEILSTFNWCAIDVKEIGNADFIATTIGINLAMEFVTPLKDKLNEYNNRVKKLIKTIRSAIDNTQHDISDSDISAYIRNAEKELEQKILEKLKDIETNTRRFSIAFAIIGFILLFLGITGALTLFLMTPLFVYFGHNKINARNLTAEANRIAYEVDKEIVRYVTGGKTVNETVNLAMLKL